MKLLYIIILEVFGSFFFYFGYFFFFFKKHLRAVNPDISDISLKKIEWPE